MPTTLPPAPGVVKTVVEGNIAGVAVANIFHWLMDDTSGLDNNQANAVAQVVHTSFVANLLEVIISSYTVQQTTAEDLTSTTGGTGVFASSHAGTFGLQEIAASTCTLITHKIARRYRGGHPRTYLPPFSGLALADPQHWTTANVNLMNTQYGIFVNDVLSGAIGGNTIAAYVNVSYHSGNALRPSPVIDPIASSVCETLVATQRRRIGR